jgi:isoleucyl-tRNA synthetase
VAHDEGLLVVIDTELDDELRAEGDVREIQRAVQDLRKQAGLEPDDFISLWLSAEESVLEPLRAHFDRLAEETLVQRLSHAPPPGELPTASLKVSGGTVSLALRSGGTAA